MSNSLKQTIATKYMNKGVIVQFTGGTPIEGMIKEVHDDFLIFANGEMGVLAYLVWIKVK
jgi:hypothetical protein